MKAQDLMNKLAAAQSENPDIEIMVRTRLGNFVKLVEVGVNTVVPCTLENMPDIGIDRRPFIKGGNQWRVTDDTELNRSEGKQVFLISFEEIE